MIRPTDETLMAYADGYLDRESRHAVERHLVADAVARRTVRHMTMVKLLTQEAYGEHDFTAGVDRLADRIRRMPVARSACAVPAPPRRLHVDFSWLTGALTFAAPVGAGMAAGMLATFVTLAVVAPHRSVPGAGTGAGVDLALGTVPPTSPLARALDAASRPVADAVGGDVMRPASSPFAQYQPVAAFKDKFGNDCMEIDAFPSASAQVPSAVVVACRGPDAVWAVQGAVSTKAQRAETRPYVEDATQAHDAMSGILSLLGATQRTSAIKSESETR
jgi:hypothetical protein